MQQSKQQESVQAHGAQSAAPMVAMTEAECAAVAGAAMNSPELLVAPGTETDGQTMPEL